MWVKVLFKWLLRKQAGRPEAPGASEEQRRIWAIGKERANKVIKLDARVVSLLQEIKP